MSEAAEKFEVEIDGGDDVVESQETETPEADEPAPEEVKSEESESEESDEGGEPKVKFSAEQQRIFDREIGRRVAKQREAERSAQEVQRQLDALRKQSQETGNPNDVEVPPRPDVWDDDYADKVAQREDALRRKAVAEARQAAIAEQEKVIREQNEREALARIQEKVQTYSGRAKELGIPAEELQVAGKVVASIGIPDDLVSYILDSEDGPAITIALSESPSDMEKLASLNPIHAALHLEREIIPRVKRKLKKVRPPEPVETLRGSGVPEKDRGPEGATYE